MPEKYRIIGLMSGSSLDGLDIACCDFELVDGQWRFAVPYATCVAYDAELTDELRTAHQLSGRDLWRTHVGFGRFCGQAVRRFIDEHAIDGALAVASHGHTVLHEPQNGFTAQIGDGAALAAEAGLPVVCDFRSTDVAKGGQGAPLVPVGDALLFGQHAFLLNIGGIANVTVRRGGTTLAFDICAANQVLNFYAARRGQAYDANGAMASSGATDTVLLGELNALPYYAQSAPKSLGNDYARDVVLPLIDRHDLGIEDTLATFCEHIAQQVARHVDAFAPAAGETLLVSGGGVFNTYLLDRLRHLLPMPVVVPDDTIIQYKEALIFAFLGLLRWRGETNTLGAVTGASADSSGGAIYLP